MAEEHKHEESIMEKIAEKIHGHDDSSSSSSDSDDEKKDASSLKTKIYRLFGRENPVHKVFGGGKRMDLSFFCSSPVFDFFLFFCRFRFPFPFWYEL